MIAPAYTDGAITLYAGDCIDVMRELEADSIDAIVCDPPYGLEFMGREWDSFKATGSSALLHSPKDEGRTFTNESGHMWDNTKALPRFPSAGAPFQAWCELWATEALRVLKPGGHLLAFGGTRTFHRLTCGIEDAGFEIRDCLSWLYGSGFPKSLDVSKAIDKAAGAEREIIGSGSSGRTAGMQTLGPSGIQGGEFAITAPATDLARQWAGWGTALKPAWEPCIVARKPLRGTVAATVAAYGTGALNIDAGRIEAEPRAFGNGRAKSSGIMGETVAERGEWRSSDGRWPPNVALDEEAAAMLDAQSGERQSGAHPAKRGAGSDGYHGWPNGTADGERINTGTGGASRFMYTAKASRSEREAWGRMALPAAAATEVTGRKPGSAGQAHPRASFTSKSERVNTHPTVKPIELMAWLLRLVTPPGGLVLDPFAGSGTTLVAARRERIRCMGIERDPRSVAIAAARVGAQYDVKLGL